TNCNRETDIVALAQAPDQRRRLFFPRIDKVEDPFWSHILAREPMVYHLREAMSHREPEDMDPVVGDPSCTQNGNCFIIYENEVISRTPIPDRIHRNGISHHRDLRKGPRFSSR